MSTTAATNRFIGSSITACAGFYQQLLTSASSIPELGDRLIRHAECARSFRQTQYVREIGLLLANLPLKKFQAAGHYYLGWAMYRGGQSEQSRVMFEQVAGSDAGAYQARALLSLGALQALKHDFASEAGYYVEALKAPHDLYTTVEATRGIAVIKAKEGYHEGAVKDFEKFLPLAANCDVATYNLYLSSLAVELGATGRKDEARGISRVVLASPFAFAYPEWQETARDLKEPDRSFVALKSARNAPHNVVTMPSVEHVESERAKYNRPAKVTNLQQWKTRMGKEDKPPEELSTKQMIYRIIGFYSNKDTTDAQRYEIYEAVEKIMSKSNPPETEPDDSKGA
jgi:tetratricopeptide (TPR) repeat protein